MTHGLFSVHKQTANFTLLPQSKEDRNSPASGNEAIGMKGGFPYTVEDCMVIKLTEPT